MVDAATLISVLRGVVSGSIDPTQMLENSLRELTPERLDYAIKNNIDPKYFFWQELNLSNQTVYQLFRLSLRRFWDSGIESVLTDANKVYAILNTNGREKVLSTPDARKYINKCTKEMYLLLYKVAWQ